MLNVIFKILGILILGIFGGFLSQAFVLPYLAGQPYAQDFQFIKEFKEKEVIIEPKQEIIIQENTALKKAVAKVKKVVVGIKSETKTGKILKGSGLIVSSDGLAITLTDIAPPGSEVRLFLGDEELSVEILQRKSGLVLLKIKGNNFPTIGFAEFEKIKLGERVFLVGKIFQLSKDEQEITQTMVNQGIVKYYGQDSIHTNIFEKYYLWGSSLFNIKGNLLGINTIDQEGKVIAIPVVEIQEFLGF